MKTIGEVLKLSAKYLQEHQVALAAREAEDLLSALLKISRLDLYLQFDRPLEEKELALYRTYIKRKAQQEPLEYITEETSFFGCALRLSPHVLIPRPETEILLEKALAQIQDPEGKKAWDLCCGSGCLGIALKKKLPELAVSLSDLSEEALQVARENGARNGVQVDFFQGDLLHPFKGKKVDYVFCNPPYISEKEFSSLDPSVCLFEPKRALVAGPSGLEFYERLSQELPQYLNKGGMVFLEIGFSQGSAVEALFKAACWKAKRLEKDWAGHDRFFFLEFE
jgi:release factor glutamine methyltransferase